MLRINQLIGLGVVGGGAVSQSELFGSATSVGSTIVCPANIQPDDVIVLFDRAQGGTVALVTPTNFISIIDEISTNYRSNLSYKVAVGTEGGSTVTGMVGATAMNKVMLVFRPNGHPNVVVGGIVSLLSSGNPADLVVPAHEASGPLVVVAAYGASDPIDPRAFTPAKLGEVNSAGTDDAWLAYKIYNSAPADVTIGMDDEGTLNQITGCYIQFVPYVAGPRSFIVNGTNEVLQRIQSTSIPNTLTFTYSLWYKAIAYGFEAGVGNTIQFFSIIDGVANTEFNAINSFTIGAPGLVLRQDGSPADWGLWTDNPDVDLEEWHHLVVRYDSPQGTASNRLRFYIDGTLQTVNAVDTIYPTLNEPHKMLRNGFAHNLGSFLDPAGGLLPGGKAGNKKLAFIDFVEGQSRAPTDFAFDNAGTWTRKPYTATVFGTHGHSLDGTAAFNDVSGNSRHFTGVNMVESANLSIDLPPWT